jgi:hypothetical protein
MFILAVGYKMAFPYDYVEPILFLDTKQSEDGFIKAETWLL